MIRKGIVNLGKRIMEDLLVKFLHAGDIYRGA